MLKSAGSVGPRNSKYNEILHGDNESSKVVETKEIQTLATPTPQTLAKSQAFQNKEQVVQRQLC